MSKLPRVDPRLEDFELLLRLKPVVQLNWKKMSACELYLNKSLSRKEARDRSLLSENQMKKALQEYRKGKLNFLKNDNRGSHKKLSKILTEQTIDWFAELLNKNANCDMANLRCQFTDRCTSGRPISDSTFHRLLKQAGYKFQTANIIPKTNNDKKNKHYRYFFVGTIVRCLVKGTIVVSINETNVSFYASKRKKWVNKKENKIIDPDIETSSLSVTLVIASTKTEIIGAHLIKGALNQVGFYVFLVELMKEIKARFKGKNDVVFVFDNIRAHKTKLKKAFCRKNKMNVITTPKYSREVDFIENLINRFEKELRRYQWKTS